MKARIHRQNYSRGFTISTLPPKTVELDICAEAWLKNMVSHQQTSLSQLLGKCLASPTLEYEMYPSQVLCLAENVTFAAVVEDLLGTPDALRVLNEDLFKKLTVLSAYPLSEALVQLKVKALIMDIIHARDVVDQLVTHQAKTADAWTWQKQLRYYFSEKAHCCTVKMSGAAMDYVYEYQGNQPKLVHTPLTDKCYLNLTQAMRFGFGGNPFGPAGTGKTETVKALGAALGRQVLVFNCDEGIDFAGMGRIFCGIVMSGAWGCFDEFNRLRQEHLSAISQQIQIIQDAIKERCSSVELLGKTIPLNLSAGIFVTLNPAGKGYGGRSILPANLKALFRPVAMGKPDKELIAEVTLFAEGFGGAKELGRQIVLLFSLCEQSLSSQLHYDWGLRSLKVVLQTASKLKRHKGATAFSDMEVRFILRHF